MKVREGTLDAEEPVEVTYAPLILRESTILEIKDFLQGFGEKQILRKWASRRLTGALKNQKLPDSEEAVVGGLGGESRTGSGHA